MMLPQVCGKLKNFESIFDLKHPQLKLKQNLNRNILYNHIKITLF